MSQLPEELSAEYQRISQRLSGPLDLNEMLDAKEEIVRLFHRTELALEELGQFKESIRELITAWKALPIASDGSRNVPASSPPAGGSGEISRSVRHDHVGASTWIERGWSAISAGEWTEAQRHLEHALVLDGTSANAQVLLGWTLMAQGELDEAIRACHEAMIHAPDHALGKVVIGAICLRKGITGEAMEHLTRVAHGSSDLRAALYANYWLGVAYLDREMPADAEEVLRKAISRGPNLAEAWLELGFALWGLDRAAEARDAWLTGAAIRHSAAAGQCGRVLEIVARGGRPERLSLY